MIYLELFLAFLKVGCFSFGGAYGAISLIRDVVLTHGWLSEETLTYMIAVSESTPGPIMVNLATYIGLSQAGISGAVLATFAVVLPAFVIILLFVAALKRVWNHDCVQAVIGGLKPCVIGIILATGVTMILGNCIRLEENVAADIRSVIVTVILGAVLFIFKYLLKKKISPMWIILCSAILGIIIWGIR